MWIGMLRAQRRDGTLWRWPAIATGESREALCRKYRRAAEDGEVPEEMPANDQVLQPPPSLLDPAVYPRLDLEVYEATVGGLFHRGEINLWKPGYLPRGRKKKTC